MNTISAFQGTTLLAQGAAADVLAASKVPGAVFFDHTDGRQIDFDLSAPRTGPGRPKLGVVSTEVTLLPRHWEWLNQQPGRASATLRRLVDAAMAAAPDPRQRREALGKILWAVAGNEPEFEEASRALYAGDRERLNALARRWSGDLPAFVENWT